MALFDSADLLARFYRLINRPTTDQSVTSADAYALLTEAQLQVARDLANHVPETQYVTEQLTTSDSGVSYTFVTEPLGGHIELRAGRAGRLLLPGADWDAGADVVIGPNGTVRFPDGKAKTFPGGLWARYVPTPGVIDGSTPPTLKPTFAREMLPHRAAFLWATQPGVAADPDVFLKGENLVWVGEPEKGKLGVLGTLKQQYFMSGAAALAGASPYWWRFIDTGEGYVKKVY